MGFIDKLLKPTPFYNAYQSYKRKKAQRVQEKLEAEYHPKRVAFYRQLLAPGDVVFDVGANVGNRVQAFLETKARVIAVEPQPACVAVLRQKLADKITIEPVGLAG